MVTPGWISFGPRRHGTVVVGVVVVGGGSVVVGGAVVVGRCRLVRRGDRREQDEKRD